MLKAGFIDESGNLCKVFVKKGEQFIELEGETEAELKEKVIDYDPFVENRNGKPGKTLLSNTDITERLICFKRLFNH
jgi:hypothetical protein